MPQWTQMRWGGSTYLPASGGTNRENLQLFMPWMTCGCPLYGEFVHCGHFNILCMSLEKQGSDWQRCHAIVSTPDPEEISFYCISTWGLQVKWCILKLTVPHTPTLFQPAAFQLCLRCIRAFFWGLRLFWFIRSVVEAPQSPILPGMLHSPPPSLVIIATMMCACSDSMTDPPAVYVWVWLIWYGCALRVWLNETQQRLLLLSFLDSNSQTFRHQSWIWNDWACCSAINKDSVKTNNSLKYLAN